MTYEVFGIPFSTNTQKEVLEWIEGELQAGGSRYIVTPNPEMIMVSRKNHEFLQALKEADMAIPDGVGVLWSSTFLSLPNHFSGRSKKRWTFWQLIYSLFAIIFYPPFIQRFFPERVAGADLFWEIIETCHRLKKRPFFLGGWGKVGEDVREKVLAKYPSLQVAGVYAGISDAEYDEETRHYIDKSNADFVFVAYSFPKQEMWLARNKGKFKKPLISIGSGGTLDFISGRKKRAPQFMRRLGLEWLFRLVAEPWRYLRIYTATLKFVRFVYKERLKSSLTKDDKPQR